MLQILSNTVLEKARSFEDALELQLTNLPSLAYSSQVAEALELGLNCIKFRRRNTESISSGIGRTDCTHAVYDKGDIRGKTLLCD
jgi:hypothetical protein